MAEVKQEDKYYFPQGHIYVLMDADWGIEIVGESGIDGDLVGMGVWEFKNRNMWELAGEIINEKMQSLYDKYKEGNLSDKELVNAIYDYGDKLHDVFYNFLTDDCK